MFVDITTFYPRQRCSALKKTVLFLLNFETTNKQHTMKTDDTGNKHGSKSEWNGEALCLFRKAAVLDVQNCSELGIISQ